MGTVSGPTTSTAGHVVLWDNTTGTLVRDSNTVVKPDWLNLLDYFVTTDTDYTAAFNRAVAAIGSGGVIYVPAGTYNVSSTIAISKSGVVIQGDGWNATQINSTNGTADVFQFTGFGPVVRDLNFNTTVSRTAGWYINFSGANNGTMVVQNVGMTSTYGGIICTAPGIFVTDVSMTFVAGGTGISLADTGAATRLTRLHMNGTGVVPTAGIILRNTVDTIISDCETDAMNVGLQISPAAGQQVSCVYIHHSLFDKGPASGSHFSGILINPSSTGFVQQITIDHCWTCGHTNSGILIENSGSGIVNNIIINGCTSNSNGGAGIAIGPGTSANPMIGIEINGGVFSGNGNGIYVNGYVNNFTIQGVMSGNYLAGANANGVVVTGSNDYYLITNNLMVGNSNVAIVDSGGGTHKFVGASTGAGANIS